MALSAGQRIIPMEVKYKPLKQAKLPSSLRSFIDKYKPETALVVNLSLKRPNDVNGAMVSFVPHTELLSPGVVL